MRRIRTRIPGVILARVLLLLLTLPLLRCEPAGPPLGSAALALSPSNPRIAQGTGQSFAVRATFPDGHSKDVSAQLQWSMVDEQGRELPAAAPGLITAEQPGRYRVRAKVAGRVIETSLQVTTATLVSVAISPRLPVIALGTRQRFAMTGTFSDGTTQDVSAMTAWSVKSVVGTGVATVDSSGLCTSKAVGKATITGRYSAKTSSTTLQVTPAVITNLAVTPKTPTIAKGTSQQFVATATFSDATVQDVTALVDWSVQDVVGTAVADIDESGNAVGLAIGQVLVSADYSGATGSTTMTVTAARAVSLTVSPLTASITAGATQRFTATATFTDRTTQDVTAAAAWTSADVSGTGVAAVDARGVATAKAAGTATIAAAYGGLLAQGTLTVTPPTLISLAISPATSSIAKGTGKQFRANGTFSDGSVQDLSAQCTWSIADVTGTGVASIDTRGAAVGKSEGKATITASYLTAVAHATLTVTPPALDSLTVNPSAVTISKWSTWQFQAVALLTDGTTQDVSTTATWSTTDLTGTSVAAVDGTGLCTGNAVGQARVTASYRGKTASGLLSVSDGFHVVPVPTTDVLWGVWGATASDVWTVGATGVVLHWDGRTWKLATALAGTTGMNAVWGSGARDVWFGGEGGLLLHWDGTTFTSGSLSPAVATIYGLWGSGPGDVWAVTTSGAYHYDGSTWSQKFGIAGTSVTAVWGSSASDVWFFEDGSVDHWDGTALARSALPAAASIFGMAGSGPRDIWAVGTAGSIFHYDGTRWTAMASPTSQLLVGVSVLSSADVMLTGDAGTILHWDGSALTALTSPTSEDLMGVLRIAGATFITGWNGVLLR